jgi:hypothetical protein
MRGRAFLLFLAVVITIVSVATVGFAASGGEPGRPDQPGKSQASQDANHDPSNRDGTYRGKSGSTPDQNGIGADHGIDNNDKTGAGTDGNNGCGNDADREDDNNGWCGRKRSNGTPAPSVSPTATATSSVGTEVLGRSFTRPEVTGRQLARTGAPMAETFLAAMALLLLGLSLRAVAHAKS